MSELDDEEDNKEDANEEDDEDLSLYVAPLRAAEPFGTTVNSSTGSTTSREGRPRFSPTNSNRIEEFRILYQEQPVGIESPEDDRNEQFQSPDQEQPINIEDPEDELGINVITWLSGLNDFGPGHHRGGGDNLPTQPEFGR